MSFFSKTIKVLTLIVGISSLSGCLPENQSLDATLTNSIGKNTNTGEFTGIESAQTESSSKIKLSWTSSDSDNIVGYNVYDTTLMGNPKLIKTVKAPADSTSITNLYSQTFYSFKVKAVKKDETEDENTKELGATPYGGAIGASVVDGSSVSITFNSISNTDLAHVYCKEGLSVIESEFKEISDTTVTSVTLTGLTQGVQYTCRVATEIDGFIDNNQVYVEFMPLGTASELVFLTQPSNGNAGVNLPTQPVVAIRDDHGNILTAGPDATALVTLSMAVSSPTVGTLRGTLTVRAVKGVATFSGLSMNEVGSKIISASKEDTSSQALGSDVLTTASDAFVILPGDVSASQTTIAIAPATVGMSVPLVANGTSAYTVTITLKDRFGNPISGVKPQFGSNKSGDVLTQPVVNTDSSGVTVGSITTTVADQEAPFRLLNITSPSGLTGVTVLSPFIAGSAFKLGYIVQPITSPAGEDRFNDVKVAVQDANGNQVFTASDAITINIANNANGALLTGTTTVSAVSGVAVFTDLGIDRTGTSYKFNASSGVLTPALSNSFNVTAATPQKIIIAGASSVLSGSCSTAITVQLQDNGNNPSKPSANTIVRLSGLSSGQVYTSSTCSGSPISGAPSNVSLTFTSSKDTHTIYLKDSKSELLSLVATDTSSVLTAGTRTVYVNPSQIAISAPSSVVSGLCSAALVITPKGADGNAAPLFAATAISAPITLVGSGSHHARLYSDSNCTTEIVDPSAFTLPETYTLGVYPINVYIKNDTAEIVSINIVDPSSAMATASGNQNISFTASNIAFSGASTVIAGTCNAYTVTMKDAAGNNVVGTSTVNLTVNGLGSSLGNFYTSLANCNAEASGSKTQVSVAAGQHTATVYFKDKKTENLSIYLSNSALGLTNSSTLSVGVKASQITISTAGSTTTSSTICSSQVTITTKDAQSTPLAAPVAANTRVNLSTTYGVSFTLAGKFYSDSSCANEITYVDIAAGSSSGSFYFNGMYPTTGTINLVGSDSNSVLSQGTLAWRVNATKTQLGNYATPLDSNGDLALFRTGVKPTQAITNGMQAASAIYKETDADGEFLYVADSVSGKLLKYDLTNKVLLGWTGYVPSSSTGNSAGSLTKPTGSNYNLYSSNPHYTNLPSVASCQSKNNAITNGWCLGGGSLAIRATNNSELGGFVGQLDIYIEHMTGDGTYVYLISNQGGIIRFNKLTGAYAGWLGWVSNGSGAILPSSACTQGTATANALTPGWCMNGTVMNASNTVGGLNSPKKIIVDGLYIYVASSHYVNRYDKSTGAFAGWIGNVSSVSGMSCPSDVGSLCTTGVATGAYTKGWTIGGATAQVGPNTTGFYNIRGMVVHNSKLYILNAHSNSQVDVYITRFDLATGAYEASFANIQRSGYLGLNDLAVNSSTGNFMLVDSSQVQVIDNTGYTLGWIGKVGTTISTNSVSLGNPSACNSLARFSITSGWCPREGSTNHSISSYEENGFATAKNIIVDTTNNYFLVAEAGLPAVKKFNLNTGAYIGTFAMIPSARNHKWIDDTNTNYLAQSHGFDDNSLYNPQSIYNDGRYLYVGESSIGRIKKINIADGSVVGSIGFTTSTPTGGVAGCTSTTQYTSVPGWCSGIIPTIGVNYITVAAGTYLNNMDGVFVNPKGITGDGTYLYIADKDAHRIVKVNASTGAFVGWIGRINSTTGMTGSCLAQGSGGITPGWCTGGNSQSAVGSNNGGLNAPTSVVYVQSQNKIYVLDSGNYRIAAFNADTGTFVGWSGGVSGSPTGCTVANYSGGYNVISPSSTAWCVGGTPVAAATADKGGAFNTTYVHNFMVDLATDGSYIYVTNNINQRIEKIDVISGAWVGAVNTPGIASSVFTTSNRGSMANNNASNGVIGLTISNNNLYTFPREWNGGYNYVQKIDATTGAYTGWQGGIGIGFSPTNSDSNIICRGASGVTPSWCTTGASARNYGFGGLYYPVALTSDDYYIYVVDSHPARIVRFPK